MSQEQFEIDWGNVLEPLKICRILEKQPHFFEGRHPKLKPRSIEGEILNGVPMPDVVATLTLRNRFFIAAQGVLLHVLLNKENYEFKETKEWSAKHNKTITALKLSKESIDKIRLAVLNIVPYLCNGDDNYNALMSAHLKYAKEKGLITSGSTEQAETLMLNEQLRNAATEHNFIID